MQLPATMLFQTGSKCGLFAVLSPQSAACRDRLIARRERISTPAEISALIARIALGDRAAFLRLYDATSAKLFGVCLRILKDNTEAEDAVQDACVKIWRNAGSYREGQYSPMSWIIAIARNTAIDRIRSRQLAHADLDDAGEVPDSSPTPEAQVIAAGEMGRISDCLAELPAQRAQAVQAAYVEGYSYAELAARFGVPVNTMRTWLHRSLKSLRECLERK